MAELLQDYQFELDGVRFGIDNPVSCTADGFKPADVDIRAAVDDNPTGSGKMFGRDFRGGAVWGFDLFVDGADPESALAAAAELRNVWWNSAEDRAGEVVELRYHLAGRTRRVYGRGRRWTPTLGNGLLSGYVPITADFELIDPYIYDDSTDSVDLEAISGEPQGGLQAPLQSPVQGLGTAEVEDRYGEFVVGGVGAWLTITFKGSTTNPYVVIDDTIRFQLDSIMAYDDEVVADPRPWNRTVTRNGSGRVKITNTSRLARLWVPAGKHVAQFGSDDPSSSATCRVSWNNANKSL